MKNITRFFKGFLPKTPNAKGTFIALFATIIISLVTIVLIVLSFVLTLVFKVDTNSLDSLINELFPLSFFLVPLTLALHSFQRSEENAFNPGPEGFRPSRQLDQLIYKEYVKRCNSMNIKPVANKRARFTTDSCDTKHLQNLVPNAFVFEQNVAKQLFTAKYTYNGSEFETICGSSEMAICMAFLKSCNHKDVC